MAETEPTSALQRKMAAGRDGAQPGGRSILRALRLALARAAADEFELALSVIGATQARCAQENLERCLSDERMLVLLDGPDGATGALSLDRECIASLIQHQTMGQVTGNAPAGRGFTGTDAAMAAPLIDAMLIRAVDLADLVVDKHCLDGFRFGARAEDARSLILTLDADRYRMFELTLDFAGGVTQGAMGLVLPERPLDAVRAAGRGDLDTGPRMDRAIGLARADLTAVLCRLRMPLADLSAMKVGDVLPLVRDRLNETDLMTITGHRITSGRLGQVGGLRAVRMNEVAPRAAPPSGQGTGPGADGDFADRITPPPERLDPMIIDETVLPDSDAAKDDSGAPDGTVGLPVVVEDESDGESPFRDMTPEEAAAEISELAGLPLADTAESRPEEVG